MIGDRGPETGHAFMADLKSRLANRVQLTSDGHRVCLTAVYETFGREIDYAMLVKIYSATGKGTEGKYSPGECVGAEKKPKIGRPEKKHISTSFAERQNLTMRMSMRRFTRLTNAFSKKVENHIHALAIYFMHCNFARIHQTLRVSPAMAAGIADKLWDAVDIIRIADEYEIHREK